MDASLNFFLINNSPEFHPLVPIQVAAVRRDFMHIELSEPDDDYVVWFARSYPDVWQRWVDALLKKKLLIEDFIPVPVHPWQDRKSVV